ncbi:conserved hypothetical protein [Burkholderia pseudomallei 1106b]|uniref:Uncharacterized protein n=1 Tax=Burkholderia pseudomallei (strain 1106a) TaxID=357348 RepID=A3P1N4_BURP0|nr:conserved hypothetical protein [Burkholderia pseudomallei 1106a]AFR18131.1 hypothetical protein BPC006_II0192 [Burkholderia pseudomallei BPC006]AUL59446.1 hypothetical protein BHT10_27080 [Burkholderia pseudomallei]EES21628.1 conserved hypothetical protein [Burkholderia pseudomallei 1106b]
MTRGGAPHGRRIRVTPRRAGPAGRHRRIPSNTAGHRQIPPHRPVHRRRSRRAPAPSRAPPHPTPPTIRRVLAPRTGSEFRAPNSELRAPNSEPRAPSPELRAHARQRGRKPETRDVVTGTGSMSPASCATRTAFPMP